MGWGENSTVSLFTLSYFFMAGAKGKCRPFENVRQPESQTNQGPVGKEGSRWQTAL